MIQKLYEYHFFEIIMLVLMILGITIKVIVCKAYEELLKESDNMTKTDNKLLKILKNRFEMSYKLKLGVNNVDIFVDKYVYKHKYGGMYLYTWDNFSGLILGVSLLISLISIGLGIVSKCGQTQILSTFFVGLTVGFVLIVIDAILNLQSKKDAFRLNVKDYLENYLKSKLENKLYHSEEVANYQREYFEEVAVESTIQAEIAETIPKKDIDTAKEDEIIEDFLNEYLL